MVCKALHLALDIDVPTDGHGFQIVLVWALDGAAAEALLLTLARTVAAVAEQA